MLSERDWRADRSAGVGCPECGCPEAEIVGVSRGRWPRPYRWRCVHCASEYGRSEGDEPGRVCPGCAGRDLRVQSRTSTGAARRWICVGCGWVGGRIGEADELSVLRAKAAAERADAAARAAAKAAGEGKGKVRRKGRPAGTQVFPEVPFNPAGYWCTVCGTRMRCYVSKMTKRGKVRYLECVDAGCKAKAISVEVLGEKAA